MRSPSGAAGPLLLLLAAVVMATARLVGATWCIARSNASDQALQTALDYACGTGADCAPIQSNGLCYLPNTLQAHASYTFNSYYQRKAMAPGSCDFAGTAVVSITDPSYGSCVYPSSPSTAGGITMTPSTQGLTPNTPTTTATPGLGGGGVTPGLGPALPNTDNSSSPCFFPYYSLFILLLFHVFL